MMLQLFHEGLCLLLGEGASFPLSWVTRENLKGSAAQSLCSVNCLINGPSNGDMKSNLHINHLSVYGSFSRVLARVQPSRFSLEKFCEEHRKLGKRGIEGLHLFIDQDLKTSGDGAGNCGANTDLSIHEGVIFISLQATITLAERASSIPRLTFSPADAAGDYTAVLEFTFVP